MMSIQGQKGKKIEDYNYIFIGMTNVPKYKLKNNAFICETVNDILVYCPEKFTNLHDSSFFSFNYLAILKKETKQNMLEVPQEITDETNGKKMKSKILFTDWTCIWIEPLESSVYKYYNDAMKSIITSYKLENKFLDSISIYPNESRLHEPIWYGYIHFPHHINKITEQKKKERSDKKKEYIINYDSCIINDKTDTTTDTTNEPINNYNSFIIP